MNQPDLSQLRSQLKRIWGYHDFRPPQGEIVRCLSSGEDALVVMPTGGGKSICFQLPALLKTGLTLVVSPLVALMENQVEELREKRLPAASLHSELPRQQKRRTLSLLAKNQLRLLYLSPETLLSQPVWQQLCQRDLPINGLILDEAHCLVQWGDTFRPAYRRLGAVRPALQQQKPTNHPIAIAAFTATANPQAQTTIRQVLQLQQPQAFLLNPYRDNLHLQVQIAWTPRGRKQRLLRHIRQHRGASGLVYVRSRKDSENLAAWLSQLGFATAGYHAGLSPQKRRQLENDWIAGKIQFVVCTSAFGMGINKPDVRWVVHFHAPILLSEYVQEVGRAGRDGKPARALTLISEPTGLLDPEDKQRRRFFTERQREQYRFAQQLVPKIPATGHVDTVAQQFRQAPIALSLLHAGGRLSWKDPFRYQIHQAAGGSQSSQEKAVREMQQYLTTCQCRWQFLLRAFGFVEAARSFRCGHCDNCQKSL
ncbi:RecQ family ATP-dependent DNA helicase [Geitlerinema sp. PCC 9228]|jgi:ATP-dependent DNA helicase RecQ|uniref:RecQ family ATP-dependent DNA helicase n=1 Tax=Geitlerinema sp. PCC 9228 TaxID=111611 RepID=UPI0008F9AA34|nr:RecQ family ATP-dependent DNA helicase [Geitlerinema sp. PCC 9228]